MQKNKIISFTIFLSFILNINSNLLSVEDSKNNNVDQKQKSQEQTQQEESFWQKYKWTAVGAATCVALLTTVLVIKHVLKNRENNTNTRNSVVENDRKTKSPIGKDYENISICGNVVTNLDTGEKCSLVEYCRAQGDEVGARRLEERAKIMEQERAEQVKLRKQEREAAEKIKENSKTESINISYRVDDAGNSLVKDLNTGEEYKQSQWLNKTDVHERYREAADKLEQAKQAYLEILKQSEPINIEYRSDKDYNIFIKDLNTTLEFTYAAWLKIQSDKKRLSEAENKSNEARKLYDQKKERELLEGIAETRAKKEKEWEQKEKEIMENVHVIMQEGNSRILPDLNEMSRIPDRVGEMRDDDFNGNNDSSSIDDDSEDGSDNSEDDSDDDR